MSDRSVRTQLAAMQPWRAYLALSLAPLAVYYAVGDIPRAAIYDAVSLGASLAVLLGIWLYRPQRPLPWLLLSAGALCFFLGDLTWDVLSLGYGENPFPSIADVAYLSGYPLIGLGFLLLILRRVQQPQWNNLFDAGIVFTGLSLVLWIVLVDPLLADRTSSPFERAVSLAYPMGDIVLLAAMSWLLLSPGASTTADRIFAASLGVMLVADVVFALVASGDQSSTDWIYVLHYSLWGAAGLHPSIGLAPVSNVRLVHRLTGRRLLGLSAAALLAPALVIVHGPDLTSLDLWVIGIGWSVICLFAVGCIVDLLGDLTRSLDERNDLAGRLQQTSDTLRTILDSSPLSVAAVDGAGRLTFWSKGAEQQFGWSAEEAVGKLFDAEPSEQTAPLARLVGRALAGESVGGETLQLPSKSGSLVDVRLFMAPLRDVAGQITGALGITEDVGDRLRLEAELFEARKMESIGRLAGGVAHDFNNILTAIIGFADLGLTEEPGPAVRSSLETIRSSAERAAGLTRQLLAFGRRLVLQPTIVAPGNVVLEMEPMLRRLIGEHIVMTVAAASEGGAILVDRTQLEQVILNLALNARDAMPDGGRLAISTARARADGEGPSHHTQMAPGDYVVVAVTDTGAGMDEPTRQHIFEPFFTTKGAGKGTGLGLATTYGIVKQSGGYVWVYSEPGRGSTFKLYFPAVAEARPVVAEEPRAPGRASGTVLVVDDEAALRSYAASVLQRNGYQVVVAADPAEAMAATMRRGADQVDVLLTDVVMPGMSGTELARRLRAGRPDLRVLLMSGYAEEVVGGSGLSAAGGGPTRFLAKPFFPDDLCRAIALLLEEPGAGDSGSSTGGCTVHTAAGEPRVATAGAHSDDGESVAIRE